MIWKVFPFCCASAFVGRSSETHRREWTSICRKYCTYIDVHSPPGVAVKPCHIYLWRHLPEACQIQGERKCDKCDKVFWSKISSGTGCKKLHSFWILPVGIQNSWWPDWKHSLFFPRMVEPFQKCGCCVRPLHGCDLWPWPHCWQWPWPHCAGHLTLGSWCHICLVDMLTSD